MKSIREIQNNYIAGNQIVIAIIGDSTTSGFGCNPSPNTWINGLSYGCVNLPRFGENWNQYLADGVTPNPVYINTTNYPSQAQQDNIGIPSAVRLFRTNIENKNASSKVYNYGGSGWTVSEHLSSNTVSTVAALVPKPDVVFINLGINSAKNNIVQTPGYNTLIQQCLDADMNVVLVKPNNIGVAYSPSGSWVAESYPNQWYPMDNWYQIRNGIDNSASLFNLEVIDAGTPSMELDITLLYDGFHPSNLGYQVIANKYINFMSNVKEKSFITIGNRTYDKLDNSNGAFRIKTSRGIAKIPLSKYDISTLILKVNNFICSFKHKLLK